MRLLLHECGWLSDGALRVGCLCCYGVARIEGVADGGMVYNVSLCSVGCDVGVFASFHGFGIFIAYYCETK